MNPATQSLIEFMIAALIAITIALLVKYIKRIQAKRKREKVWQSSLPVRKFYPPSNRDTVLPGPAYVPYTYRRATPKERASRRQARHMRRYNLIHNF